MALGTVTSVALDPHNTQAAAVAMGDLKMTCTTVVGEASYTTGGPSITPQQLGFTTACFAAQAEVSASTGSNATSTVMSPVITNSGQTIKLKCFDNTNTEIVSTTNVSGVTWQILAWGY
jgi:hypothetical protein